VLAVKLVESLAAMMVVQLVVLLESLRVDKKVALKVVLLVEK
jgi:hypothetical protein